MHDGIKQFLRTHADKVIGRTLDIGSRNINGCVRDVLPITVGIDMVAGKGVDVVCKAEEMQTVFTAGEFDAVTCCEMMEHCEQWKAALQAIWYVLRDGGWFLFTMSAPPKKYHAYPDDYWRMDENAFRAVFGKFGAEPILLGDRGISIGNAIQKTGELPDLANIHLATINGRSLDSFDLRMWVVQ